ncbi:glycosyl hydrolases family 17 domain-containing protein [Hirsutella rhossiliensis]|uniref:Glycosyl hydrolases family 17 domain-containing protein n=1 Tax=Hirsutella rhossiliensis TaxID=111463 RepID=A0A9P8MRU1_9HYPO|nr:glycosyl hydrolases family 17 domain-containing protein [Hirsutella rhossiliensis]KAH0960100.1 glycosyl hydrolases family 17 domain-containing protein [Hirsutella rhossiliensis]
MVLGRLLLPAIALGPLVAGHPTGNNVARREGLEEEHATVYDSTVAKPTQVPDVVLFVNEAGETIGSAAEDVLLLPTDGASSDWLPEGAYLSSPGASPPLADGNDASDSRRRVSAHVAHDLSGPANSPKSATHTIQAPAAKPKPARSDAEASSHVQPFNRSDATSHGSSSRLFGISYAPYRADHKCKSKTEIAKDFERFGKYYSMVRIYGTDCDQVGPVRAAAKAHGMKVFLGIWDPAAVKAEAQKIIDVFHGDWNMVDTVSVGNELVNNHQSSPENMVRAVGVARSVLRKAGYRGPVVTVDTFVAYLDHSELGQASDYCAINAHAFFDSTISAAQAGRWLQDTVKRVKSVCPGSKRVVVTETGWPTKGDANGHAVPGLKNQKFAMDSIKHEFSANPADVVLFSAFNDLWKKRESATFNADQYWGIDGAVSHSDT